MHLPRRIIFDKGHGYIPQFWLLWWHDCETIVYDAWHVYPLAYETLEEAKNHWPKIIRVE